MTLVQRLTTALIFIVISGSAPELAWSGNDPEYLGAETCGQCHENAYKAWQGSHHDQAMDHASESTVLGDFSNVEITVHGVTSTFLRRDGKYLVRTDDADGTLKEFEITHTFGVEPLQQYLVTFPDGRLQALGLAWDSRPDTEGGQRWYHLYGEEFIGPDDELHWTGAQQNWNYMCADCHSTNLRKNYDPNTDRFATDWAEIDVACEACHGPGQSHVTWAGQSAELRAADVDRGLSVLLHDRKGVDWIMDTDSGQARREGGAIGGAEVQMCAACHSRRGLIKEGRERDPEFLDHHLPALLTEGLYHADGQIHDEVYVWGSFTQSKMHEAGVTCSDCHDPHSAGLRADGADVCARCHLPSTFATTQHHGHETNGAGADCLGCHMPAKIYMGVDDRRDHSMRPPRPDLSASLGTPNACNQCHEDKSVPWAVDAYNRLYGEPGDAFQHWSTAFHQARQGLPQAEVSLLTVIGKAGTPEIIRATAVLELRQFLSPLSGQVLEQVLHDNSGLVRLAAIRVLDVVPMANRFSLAGHLLRDPLRSVRAEAGRVLAGTPRNQLNVQARGDLQRALKDYYDIQMLNADRPESSLNLGNLSLDAGNATQAEQYYRAALQRDPAFVPSMLNLAELYRSENMLGESTRVLQSGLKEAPDSAALHHALGLAQVRQGNTDAALKELRNAVELAPEEPRFAYVLGVALNSNGSPEEAIATLETAQAAHPNNRDVLFALATMERDRGNSERAKIWTNALLSLNPGDTQASALLQELESRP